MCIHLQIMKISWRQTSNLLRTTANVVITHAVVYALVTTGICMYSCRNVWYAILYDCRHIKYSSHAIWIPYWKQTCTITTEHYNTLMPSQVYHKTTSSDMQYDQILPRIVLTQPVRVRWSWLATMDIMSTNGQTTGKPRIGGNTFMGGIKLC